MNKLIKALTFAAALLALTPFAANAGTSKPDPSHDVHHDGHGDGAHSVPEFDPGATGAALTLLAGGALVLSGRRRRAI